MGSSTRSMLAHYLRFEVFFIVSLWWLVIQSTIEFFVCGVAASNLVEQISH
jgi:hypothetical protein